VRRHVGSLRLMCMCGERPTDRQVHREGILQRRDEEEDDEGEGEGQVAEAELRWAWLSASLRGWYTIIRLRV
jgi:hypothetical protein